MPPAARITDMHVCPMVTGVVPHVGGPILPPGCPTVLIGFLPAARATDMATCVGPPDSIMIGSPTVLIGNLMAARIGDPTVHGGVIVLGCFTVIIGEAAVPDPSAPMTPSAEHLDKGAAGGSKGKTPKSAIQIIADSAFAKTDEGKKVLNKIKELKKAGKIKFRKLDGATRGQWEGGQITVNSLFKRNRDAIASELVHEATHALNEDEFPASKTKLTIDEEMRTNTNQLDLYEEQHENGYRDPELDRRQKAREDGTLRDDVRGRYPNSAESL
jgi:uncharacterized Zn-binding protein involved in type VI secretion